MEVSIWATLSSSILYFLSLLVLLIFLEQISYLKNKRSIPGLWTVLPFIGSAISLVCNPTKFWDYIVGYFIVFIRSSDLSHKIFANICPDTFHLVGHPFGKKLFGEYNLIYMMGQEHKDLRRQIAPNFTPQALSTYTSLQHTIIHKHLLMWEALSSASSSQPITLRFLCRDMNLDTSHTVFVGPYLSPREKFNHDYSLFNVGLMKLAIDLSGFAFRRARFAVNRLINTLACCTEQSKQSMKAGNCWVGSAQVGGPCVPSP